MMKKLSLHNEISGEYDVSQLPTQRIAAVFLSPRQGNETQKKTRRIISSISVFFVVVQLLLLARFFLLSTFPAYHVAWVAIIYTASSMFDLPFHLLFHWLSLTTPGNIELYTLVAILCYGLIARGIVRFCKAIAPLLTAP